MRSARWTTTAIAPAVAALCLSGCASVSAPISPTIRAMGTIQLREQRGWTPDEWAIHGDTHVVAFTTLVRWTSHRHIRIEFIPDLEDENGDPLLGLVFTEPTGYLCIRLHAGKATNTKLYALIHELAHVYATSDLPEDAAEVFAELVAMQVCTRLKLDTTAATAAYLMAHAPSAVQWKTALTFQSEVDAVVNMLTHAALGGT